MGATRVGVIAEGRIDYILVGALLQRIAHGRAQFQWPLMPEDVADFFPIRKTGHGGVLDKVQRLVRALRESNSFGDYSFFVVLLDRRTEPAQKKIGKLIRGQHRFVSGIAVQEIEAWWLGDRTCTLSWAGMTDGLPPEARYAAAKYKAEKDPAPKKTLDEITMLSDVLDMRYGEGNTELATLFAEDWRESARLDDIERQCPKGFRKFCRRATNALKSAKAKSGRLL